MEFKVIVYSSNMCQHCLKLKEFLQSNSIPFEEKNIGTAESLTELRVSGCFSIEAPILLIGRRFITEKEMFQGEELQGVIIKTILRSISEIKK